jgi:acetyl/propionyl-CoA carboxylase alpha subunit/acetyl-CoA carboxylase carboxyltransferase component
MNERPIHCLGIANRGEAAVRCLRSVKALREREGSDLRALVLYTRAERDAPFVRHADVALELPAEPGREAQAYLDSGRVLESLIAGGADAVWPGWGFLSEEASFAAQVGQAGLRFLGPGPEVLRRLGDKIEAKRIAEGLGVPVIPWSGAEIADEAAAHAASRALSFPMLLKASAGGGGRGIRIVENPLALDAAFRSARAEARAAFGDERLFLEERVRQGRHVEVQIAADAHGHVFSLGLRDCSVQRRHQKVIEEAPPPGLSEEIGQALQEAAVRLATHVGYVGLGTVEFLVEDGAFYFLEVNPRLQVEHGVTEVVTGLDLVELQIRVARGESLEGLSPRTEGAAIEARLCAEDPDAGFAPSPGRIARFEAALGPRVRIDTGFATGSAVPASFDSLVAKLIASGSSREDARARLVSALADLEVVLEGGATNKGFLLSILDSQAFRAGGVDSGWLDRDAGEPEPELALEGLVAAAILAYQRNRRAARLNFYSDMSDVSPSRVPASKGQRIDLSYRGESYQLRVFAIGSWRYRVHLDGRVAPARLREESEHAARLEIEGRTLRILHDAGEAGLRVEVEGRPHRFGWQTAGHVRAASPAMVVAVHVKPGDRVSAGDSLGLLEAMKTEIAFRAPVGGLVREVRAGRGQQVAAGDILLVIESGEEPSHSAAGRRLELREEPDPLDLLVGDVDLDGNAVATLASADAAEPERRREALEAAREEIRRVLLGYDVNPERCQRLLGLLAAQVDSELSDRFLEELAEIRVEIQLFADIEQLFVRAPRASVSGPDGPSNAARLRMYVRRMRASGAGLADSYLDLVGRAVSHFGVAGLEASDALERAVLRLLGTQRVGELRPRLALGLVRRLSALARAGVHLSEDAGLADALARIAAMRGLVPDALADAALEARYEIFQSPAIARDAEKTTKQVESWLALAESESVPPPEDVLVQLASAPRALFERVGRFLGSGDPRRRAVALAAHVYRLYAPADAPRRTGGGIGEIPVERVEFEDGRVVLGAASRARELEAALATLERMVRAERAIEVRSTIFAVELLVPDASIEERSGYARQVEKWILETRAAERVTLSLESSQGGFQHETWELQGRRLCFRDDLLGVHPETAQRIDLMRLCDFELERLPGAGDLYCFRGRHRAAPEDERLFVLADVRGLSFEEGREAALHVAAFEHAFYEATRQLRGLVGLYDPGRRLHWNRLGLFVAPEVILEPETAAELARKLHPATRHLGLDKVTVRLNLIDAEAPDEGARPVEIVISDPTGSQMELAWREPRGAPLAAASQTEQRLAESRRRGLLYPYEVLRLLVGESNGFALGRGPAPEAVRGRFEEWDLEPGASRAVCVAGRPLGRNESSVVFGVLSTPTEKVPEGLTRVVVLSDATLGMGSLGPAESDRLVAALDLAESLSVPLEWIPVSAGARIAMDSGTENLDATARVARRIIEFTQAGGVVHIIVHGVNVGAQSYFDALATMGMTDRGALIMLPGGSMVLTGRAALEASGSVSGEDESAIGGFERVMGPNGEAQYFAHDFLDAYRVLSEHYRYTYVVPGEGGPRRHATSDPAERDVTLDAYPEEEGPGFRTIGEIFDDVANPGRKRPFAMRNLMRCVIDRDGGWLERWRTWIGAETAIVWDAHLGGHSICLVGIESQTVRRDGYRPADGPEAWAGGTLFPQSSKKVARALRAASGNRPAVILANLSGFDGSPESMRKLQLEYGAEIARAVVNFQGPILFLVVSRYHGGAYVVFSRALNPNLHAAALEGSYASVIGGGPAAAVVFGREVRARAAADPDVTELREAFRQNPTPEAREALERRHAQVMLEMQAEVAAEFDAIHTVERAREVGSIEEILAPARMRPYLIGLLDGAQRKT